MPFMLAVESTNTELGPGSSTIKIVPRTKVERSVIPYKVDAANRGVGFDGLGEVPIRIVWAIASELADLQTELVRQAISVA